MTPDERQIEELLRLSRPEPSATYAARAERELFPEPPVRRPWLRLPAVRIGSALVAGLATVLLVLSLAGAGPLGSKDDAVHAKERCRSIVVTRVERVPTIVTDANGTSHVRYRKKPARRTVRRCRQR